MFYKKVTKIDQKKTKKKMFRIKKIYNFATF